MRTSSDQIDPVFVRLAQSESLDGKKKSTRYAEIAEGIMVPPVSTGPNQSAWLRHELIALNEGRIAGLDSHGMRELVAALIGMRGRPITWDEIRAVIATLAEHVRPPRAQNQNKRQRIRHQFRDDEPNSRDRTDTRLVQNKASSRKATEGPK